MKPPRQVKITKPGEGMARDARVECPPPPSAAIVGGMAAQQVPTDETSRLVDPRSHGQRGALLSDLLRSDLVAHNAVLEGLPCWTLLYLCNAVARPLAAADILRAVGGSTRTWRRISQAPDMPLDTYMSDRVYRLASVRALAGDVLGSPDAADEWLGSAAIGLGYVKPIDLFGTTPGALVVKTLLQRMKYGVYT